MAVLMLILMGKLFAIYTGLKYFRALTPPYRLVFYLVLVALFAEALGYYIAQFRHHHNTWMFNIYIIVEDWMTGLVAIQLIPGRKKKNLFLMLLFACTIFWGIQIRMWSLAIFSGSSMIFGSFMITFMYIMILFSNSLFTKGKLYTQAVFWLCISNLMYFCCDIPFMGLHNYISAKLPKTAIQFAIINDSLDIVRFPLIGICFLLLGKQSRTKSKLIKSDVEQ